MFVLARAVTYATLFIGLVLIFVPSRVLSWSGINPPAHIGIWQGAGMILGATGAAGRPVVHPDVCAGRQGDRPRRLTHLVGSWFAARTASSESDVLGAGLALAGAALFYRSLSLAGYAGLFLVTMHAFVVVYEESTLRQTFGNDYEAYCRRVNRWWPRSSTQPT